MAGSVPAVSSHNYFVHFICCHHGPLTQDDKSAWCVTTDTVPWRGRISALFPFSLNHFVLLFVFVMGHWRRIINPRGVFQLMLCHGEAGSVPFFISFIKSFELLYFSLVYSILCSARPLLARTVGAHAPIYWSKATDIYSRQFSVHWCSCGCLVSSPLTSWSSGDRFNFQRMSNRQRRLNARAGTCLRVKTTADCWTAGPVLTPQLMSSENWAWASNSWDWRTFQRRLGSNRPALLVFVSFRATTADSCKIDVHIFISTTEAHRATVSSPLYSNNRCRFEAKRMKREVPSWTGSVPLKSALSIVFE